MLIDARWQRNLVTALHLEPLLKWKHKEGVSGNGGREMKALPMKYGSNDRDRHRLSALLRYLGMSAAMVEASIRRDDAKVSRAAEIIAEWVTFLPEDCVKAMVNDGWHWSV